MEDELGKLREKTNTAEVLQNLTEMVQKNQQTTQPQEVKPQFASLTDEQKTLIQDDPSQLVPIVQKMLSDTLGPLSTQIAGQTNRSFLMNDLKTTFGARFSKFEGPIDEVLREEPNLLNAYSQNPTYVKQRVAEIVRGKEALALDSGAPATHVPVPGVTEGATTIAQPPASGDISRDEVEAAAKMGITPEMIKAGREMKKKQGTWSD